MSTVMAKYTVRWGYRQDFRHETDSWIEATDVFLAHRSEMLPDIIGEGYDADCDGEGFFCCSTGLTEEESEELQDLMEAKAFSVQILGGEDAWNEEARTSDPMVALETKKRLQERYIARIKPSFL